jgi:hypothetical protein
MKPPYLYKESFKLFIGQETTLEGKHFKRLMLSKLEIKRSVRTPCFLSVSLGGVLWRRSSAQKSAARPPGSVTARPATKIPSTDVCTKSDI